MQLRITGRAHAVNLAWLANLALGVAIGSAYVAPEAIETPRGWIFVCAALVSSIALLLLVPAAIVFVATFVPWPRRALALFQAFVWTLFQLLLFADTRIYGLFRYHFNGMVWNVITTPGAEDAVEIGARTWLVVATAGMLLFVVEERLWTRVWTRGQSVASANAPPRDSRRFVRMACIGVACAVVLEKALYAHSDLTRDSGIVSLSRLFPYYQRLTIKRLVQNVFGVRLADRPTVAVDAQDSLLAYPRAPLELASDAPRPNILIVVIDSLRADMLAEATMPEVSRYAASARRFDDHVSGGNATRFGIFSLLYGIHGSYWMPVYQAHAPPVLVTELDRLGYDMRVLSTASMNYPEFRSTAWVTIEDRVEDRLPSKVKHERDTLVGERFDQWLGERAARGAREPFFCFALLDAPHGTHSFPPDEAPFQPCAEGVVDYLSLGNSPADDEIQLLFNSYRNAVRHADRVTGRMLASLAEHGEMDDTLVVITGDHGEEFRENGYYGHTSNYTPEQVHVAFVLGGPGIPPGVETRPTSHLDVAPTLLEHLGADPRRRSDHSFGENLLSPPATRSRLIAGWDEIAMWVDGGVLFVPLEGHKGGVEGYDYDWKRLAREDEFLSQHGIAIGRMARECRWFFR